MVYNETYNTPLYERIKHCREFQNSLESDVILLSETREIHFQNEISAHNFYLNEMGRSVTNGHEGLMVKSYDSIYSFEKTKDWIKLKPTETIDLPIVEIQQASKGSKYDNIGIGAFLVRGFDKGHSFEISVGGGLSDEIRIDAYQNPEKYLGKIIEIKYDYITKSEDKEFYSVRFPRFVRFREDKE